MTNMATFKGYSSSSGFKASKKDLGEHQKAIADKNRGHSMAEESPKKTAFREKQKAIVEKNEHKIGTSNGYMKKHVSDEYKGEKFGEKSHSSGMKNRGSLPAKRS